MRPPEELNQYFVIAYCSKRFLSALQQHIFEVGRKGKPLNFSLSSIKLNLKVDPDYLCYSWFFAAESPISSFWPEIRLRRARLTERDRTKAKLCSKMDTSSG
jgi:hypothetical protein